MSLLYYDPAFLAHETGRHPERAERLRRIVAGLAKSGLDERCTRPTWQPATDAELLLVHEAGHIADLRDFAAAGGGQVEADTVMVSASYPAARLAAGAACDAVRKVVAGHAKNALCLVRPPGHHALPNGPMGFCLFNNIAVAAKLAVQELGLDRVLVIDWDVHHGNGTQDMFWTDPRVGFFSIHRYPFYPGSGAAFETGSGPGLGTTRNVPIEFGTSRKEYFALFERELFDFAARMKPQLVFISAGFDAHREDPVGSLGLETEDFALLTEIVLGVAREHADGKVVSLLEGGYHVDRLAEGVALHLEKLLVVDLGSRILNRQ